MNEWRKESYVYNWGKCRKSAEQRSKGASSAWSVMECEDEEEEVEEDGYRKKRRQYNIIATSIKISTAPVI